MPTTMQILRTYKLRVQRRFFEILARHSAPPTGLIVPSDPQKALELGMQLGRNEGYGTGLVDGTALGLDVGLEAVDAMLSQPVLLGPIGVA